MKIEKVKIIESHLSDLLKSMSEEEYLKIINSNVDLKYYDQLMVQNDNELYYEKFLEHFSDEMLDRIIEYLKKTI